MREDVGVVGDHSHKAVRFQMRGPELRPRLAVDGNDTAPEAEDENMVWRRHGEDEWWRWLSFSSPLRARRPGWASAGRNRRSPSWTRGATAARAVWRTRA